MNFLKWIFFRIGFKNGCPNPNPRYTDHADSNLFGSDPNFIRYTDMLTFFYLIPSYGSFFIKGQQKFPYIKVSTFWPDFYHTTNSVERERDATHPHQQHNQGKRGSNQGHQSKYRPHKLAFHQQLSHPNRLFHVQNTTLKPQPQLPLQPACSNSTPNSIWYPQTTNTQSTTN